MYYDTACSYDDVRVCARKYNGYDIPRLPTLRLACCSYLGKRDMLSLCFRIFSHFRVKINLLVLPEVFQRRCHFGDIPTDNQSMNRFSAPAGF